jgi:hypothetical protein
MVRFCRTQVDHVRYSALSHTWWSTGTPNLNGMLEANVGTCCRVPEEPTDLAVNLLIDC